MLDERLSKVEVWGIKESWKHAGKAFWFCKSKTHPNGRQCIALHEGLQYSQYSEGTQCDAKQPSVRRDKL